MMIVVVQKADKESRLNCQNEYANKSLCHHSEYSKTPNLVKSCACGFVA